MTVTLLKPYQGNATGAVVMYPDSTEAALIAQGFATAASGQPAQTFPAARGNAQRATVGGLVNYLDPLGIVGPTVEQGPRNWPNTVMKSFATGGTSAVHVAGSWYRGEVFIPYLAQWLGFYVLNGATVGTDNLMIGLWDSAGNLITNSAVAGVLSAGANTPQQIAFLTAPILPPGRYFVGVQCNGTTATTRRIAAGDGAFEMCSVVAGTFGTVPATFTVPTTFTTATSPMVIMYR